MRPLVLFVLLLTLPFSWLASQPSDSLSVTRTSSWTVLTFGRSDLQTRSTRTLEGLLTFVPGVTRVTSPSSERLSAGTSPGLHLRGSREGEVEYRFGGVPATDRWSNTNGVPFLPEMLERADVHTGAYGPRLGMMGGGVVDLALRRGGDAVSFEATVLTDDFARPGEQILGTSSYGWTNAIVTVGAPLPLETSVFVAAELSRQANVQPMYLDPINVTLAPDHWFSGYYQPPPAPFVIGRNHVPSQSAERSVVQWNIVTTALGPSIAFFGSSSADRTRQVTWPGAVTSYYAQSRIPWLEEGTTFAALTASEDVAEGIAVSASVSYRSWRRFTSDPAMGEQWHRYADSAANAAVGYPGFTSRYTAPRNYSAISSLSFFHPSAPPRVYQRQTSSVWTGSFEGRAALSDRWTGYVSGEMEWWTLRKFHVGNVFGISSWDTDGDGVIDLSFASKEAERWYLIGTYQLSNFGYDAHGSEVDDGVDAPRRPSLAAASVGTTFKDGRVTFDAGVRAQWISMDMSFLPPQRDPLTGGSDWSRLDAVWDFTLDTYKPGVLRRTETEAYLLPRLSVRYEGTTGAFFASYGEYAETQPHSQVQLDDDALSGLLGPYWQSPYNLGGGAVPFMVQASRTRQFEAGFVQRVSSGVTVRTTVYHKRLARQVQLGRLATTSIDQLGPVAFDNGGEGSSAGVEAGVQFVPAPELEADLAYAWTRAEGLTSYPRSNRLYFTDEYTIGMSAPPLVARPLAYERVHRLVGSIGYAASPDGWLSGLRFRLFGCMESGTPYTMVEPPINFGSATPWNAGVRPIADVRTSVPTEFPGSSRTPWVTTLDLSVSYDTKLFDANVGVFALVTNVLDTKNVINVYPTTGSPNDDGWLRSDIATNIRAIPQYEELYRYLNLQNRMAYIRATGTDIYGAPRQLRIGARVGI